MLFGGFSLLLPVLLPGVLFIIAIKRNLLSGLNRPIDGGLNLAGKRLFGPSKTWRGVFFYVVGAPVVVLALNVLGAQGWSVAPVLRSDPLQLGLSWGLAYVGGELLNSFVKRRLGIGAGLVAGSSIGAKIQAFFDNTDGSLAVGLLLLFGYHVEWQYLLVSFVLGLTVHALTDIWMRKLQLKK
jgi:hypothetical protein